MDGAHRGRGGDGGTTGASAAANRFLDMTLAHGRFIVKQRLGGGSFGDIYLGIDTWKACEIAIKLEQVKARHPQLNYESKIYKLLHSTSGPSANGSVGVSVATDVGPTIVGGGGVAGTMVSTTTHMVVGIPRMHHYGVEGDFNIMVLDLCGPSLEDLFNYCGRRFTLKTVCLLADQMLRRLEYVHSKHLVHRDLKPENFVMGMKDKGHHVNLIDFGLSKKYWDARPNQHIPYKEGKPLTGTARYCSVNTHLGIEQSRRDDMESIGYILLYFLRGSLPWQGIRAAEPSQKTVRIGEKKISIGIDYLCKDEPPAFAKYMKYCRSLKFEESPDYEWCRCLFKDLSDREGVKRDWIFDWVDRRRKEREVDARTRLQEQHVQNEDEGPLPRAAAAEGDRMGSGNESDNNTNKPAAVAANRLQEQGSVPNFYDNSIAPSSLHNNQGNTSQYNISEVPATPR